MENKLPIIFQMLQKMANRVNYKDGTLYFELDSQQLYYDNIDNRVLVTDLSREIEEQIIINDFWDVEE